jgi:hypothetical protein
MHHAVASIAVCFVYASSVNAAEILLETGIEGFVVDQPAPAEVVEKLGPSLDASGSEELRVAAVIAPPGEENLVERWQSPERTIRLVEFIRGREVQQSWVTITFNVRTHEVTLLNANFLPDRGLSHNPRLTAAQARAKAKAHLRNAREPVGLDETPARLAYDSELVWIFEAKSLSSYEPYELSVSSATGKLIRMRVRWLGCFGSPPGQWIDLPLN